MKPHARSGADAVNRKLLSTTSFSKNYGGASPQSPAARLKSPMPLISAVIASRSAIVALIGAAYIGVTIPMAIRSEEAFLRRAFGPTYDLYRRDEAPPMVRRFSLAHARRNREHRAVAGLIAGFAILAARLLLSI